jgi:hypothetical protein
MNVFVPMLLKGDSSAYQTVSELSAVGIPTRPLWIWRGSVYTLLMTAFGWGVWGSSSHMGSDGRRISANLPTPWVGVWERIRIGIFLLWIVVLAVILLRTANGQGANVGSDA